MHAIHSAWFTWLDVPQTSQHSGLNGLDDHAVAGEGLDVLATGGVETVAVEDEVRAIALGSVGMLRNEVGGAVLLAKLVATIRRGGIALDGENAITPVIDR